MDYLRRVLCRRDPLQCMSEEELLERWVRKMGEREDVYSLLRTTGSYLSGMGLYHLIQKRDFSYPVEIYASSEGAKRLCLEFGVSSIGLFYEDEDKGSVFLQCRIGMAMYGEGFVIYVCEDPLASIEKLPVNHLQLYFDGSEIHMEVLEEPEILEFPMRENPYLKNLITPFRNLRVREIPALGVSEYHYLVKYLYEKMATRQDMKGNEYYFFILDTFLLDFSFDELIRRLESVKSDFLPDFCEGEVRVLLFYFLKKVYHKFTLDTKRLANKMVMESYGISLEEIPMIRYQADSDIRSNEKRISRLKKVAELQDKLEVLRQIRNKTRRVKLLEFFTPPSRLPLEEVSYDEVKEDKCMDMESLSFYNINAYLNGEAVMAYSEEDEKGEREAVEDYALEPVPPEVARKRLVFFVASDERLTIVKPYCYHLDNLERGLMTSLYSDECKNGPLNDPIHHGFSNPLFKIPLETNIYVRLSELLRGLYNTQSQVFLLIPTREVQPRTSSIGTTIYKLGVSGDHCQEGTDKRVYKIVVCGKGSDKCYPLRADIPFQLSTESRVDPHDYSKFKKRYDEEGTALDLAQINQLLQE